MWDTLTWIYMLNATILVLHEIDSAYWQEWDMLRLPGGIGFFLVLHIPIVFLILYGLLAVSKGMSSGLIFSLVLSLAGVAAFCVHMIFMKLGRPEFKAPVSIAILIGGLVTSVVQGYLTLRIMWQ